MDNIQVKYYKLTDIKPYEKNPRKNDAAVQYVANSIDKFGFKQPIVIDKNNVIVCGHTRYKAAQQLGHTIVPCIMADDLTDEEIKAYRLADNKVSEYAEWDDILLDEELEVISDIDMQDYGFEVFEFESHEGDTDPDKYKDITQDRVSNILNIGKENFEGVGKYDIPQIEPVKIMPRVKEWIGFNYVMSDDEPKGKGVHFFVDDYQFERVWNNPEKYIEKLKQYECVLTPDFSPYSDMPLATQIFNHYRKHWVGAYWQSQGITVIPTIRASRDERSLEWFCDGEPFDGIVAISSMWTKDEDARDYFVNKEYEIMYEKLQPRKVLLYGKAVDGLKGDIEIIESFARKQFNKLKGEEDNEN